MLSLWPALLDFAHIAPLILRLTLGGTFVLCGLALIWQPERLPVPLGRFVGFWEFALGISLVLGFLVQLTSLLLSLEVLGYFWLKLKLGGQIKLNYLNLVSLLAIALALIFLGPGLLAFDLAL